MAQLQHVVGERLQVGELSAYLADGGGPGIVVLHEWWGLVPHIEDVCDRLAAVGFTALAPDLYHGATAPDTEPDDAEKLLLQLDRSEPSVRSPQRSPSCAAAAARRSV